MRFWCLLCYALFLEPGGGVTNNGCLEPGRLVGHVQDFYQGVDNDLDCCELCMSKEKCTMWSYTPRRGQCQTHNSFARMLDGGEGHWVRQRNPERSQGVPDNGTHCVADESCVWKYRIEEFGDCTFDECRGICSPGCDYIIGRLAGVCSSSCQAKLVLDIVFTPQTALAVPEPFFGTVKAELASLLGIDPNRIVNISGTQNGDGTISVNFTINPAPDEPPTNHIARMFAGDVKQTFAERPDLPILQTVQRLVCSGCPGRPDPINELCKLPIDDGSAVCGTDLFEIGYAYNIATEACESFTYYPCPELGTNANYFTSELACFRNCPYLQEMESPRLDVCDEALDTGETCPAPAAAAESKFYFDSSDCSEFQFEGCNGTSNNFKNQYDCEVACDSPLGLTCHMDFFSDLMDGTPRGTAEYTATDASVLPCRLQFYNALATHSTMWDFDCYGNLTAARSTCEANDGVFCTIDLTVRLTEFTEIACFPSSCDSFRDLEFLLLGVTSLLQETFDETELAVATECGGGNNEHTMRAERQLRPRTAPGLKLLQTYPDCFLDDQKAQGTIWAAYFDADDASECHMLCNEADSLDCETWYYDEIQYHCYLFSDVTGYESDTDFVSGPRDCACSNDDNSECPDDYSQCKSSVCKVCDGDGDCPTCGSSADRDCNSEGQCDCIECFSKSSTVYVENEGPVTLGDLEIGQKILAANDAGDLFYDEVWHMGHTIPATSSNKIASLLHISHEFGSIDVTADHLIYASPENMPPSEHCISVHGLAQACTYGAGKVGVGSVIYVSTNLEDLRPTAVQNITRVQNYVRGVMTMNGNVIVDGTLSSCYRGDHELVHNRLQPVRETYQNLPWLFQKPIYFGVYLEAFAQLWPTINTAKSAENADRFDVLAFGEHAWFITKLLIVFLLFRKLKKSVFK